MAYIKTILKTALTAVLITFNYGLLLLKFFSGFLFGENCDFFPLHVSLSIIILISGITSLIILYRLWRKLLANWIIVSCLIIASLFLLYSLMWSYAFDALLYNAYYTCKVKGDCITCEILKQKNKEGFLD